MRVILELPVNDIGARIRAFDPDGEEVEVARIEIEPLFYAARSSVPIGFGRVYAQRGADAEGKAPGEEEEVQRFVLAVSGVTATCSLKTRSEPKLSAFESADDKE